MRSKCLLAILILQNSTKKSMREYPGTSAIKDHSRIPVINGTAEENKNIKRKKYSQHSDQLSLPTNEMK